MWSETLPYRKYREPYAPALFKSTAKTLHLTPETRLLDLACGTGTLAFGFAQYVGSLTGVELEEPMVDAARAEATRRKIDIRLVCSGVEDMPNDLGEFDIVTIGKAHWFLPKAATIAKLNELIAPKGHILICTTAAHKVPMDSWEADFRRIKRRWNRQRHELISPEEFFADSPFTFLKALRCTLKRHVSVEDVLMRALAYHGTTPEQLGPKKDEFLDELRAAVTPHAVNGRLMETLVTMGIIYGRKS